MTTFVNVQNAKGIGLFLFIFSFILYASVRGFSFSIFADDDMVYVQTDKGLLNNYIVQLIALFAAACPLLWASKKSKFFFWITLLLTFIVYTVGGFRYRFVLLGITIFIVYQLFPAPKKINFAVIIPLLIVAYLFFALMDVSRVYGRGLNKNVAENTKIEDLYKGPSESSSVFSASEFVMNKYNSKSANYVYFEPLWCTITMPIPRAIYPNKPNAEYIHNAGSNKHKVGGAAVFCFTEAFMSFGWLGIILNGLLIGLISRLVWNNYVRNRNNLGAILFLGLYNGWCYVLISRGYMAQAVTTFIFYTCLPFWLGKFYLWLTRFTKKV